MRPAIYLGDVVHKRLRPVEHALRYRVFSMFLDADRIADAAAQCRLFSYNRPNIISVHDRDLGGGDGTPPGAHVRSILKAAGHATAGLRVFVLCYPRVCGYVFNPLTVYYCLGADGDIEVVVYEVSNTFGERKSYVVPAGPRSAGVYAHGCRKQLFVSPFAMSGGRYGFRVTEPGDEIMVAVMLRDDVGPLIKTHFRGTAHPLSDRMLAWLMVSVPFLTFKVMAAIHWEAAKLWWKGVPLVRGHRSPRYSVSTVDATGQN
jgi:hypothetical protein